MAKRRRKVASLYLRGAWQPEIATLVGVSQSTVSRDLAVVRKQWLKDAKADYDAKVAEQLAKIDAVELEAWAEWQKSKGRERTKRAIKRYGAKGGKTEKTEETTTVETLLPEARYLEIIHKCIERRCKLLGLDAPERKKIEGGAELVIVDKLKRVVEMSEDEFTDFAGAIPDLGSHGTLEKMAEVEG